MFFLCYFLEFIATRPFIVNDSDAESTPIDEFPNKGYSYHCSICQKKFKKHIWFQKHITTHANHKINSCEICNKKLSSQKSVKRHREIHNIRRKRYKYKICKSSFLQISDMNYHQKTIHIKHELIKCLHCTKTYATQKQLKIHNIHVHSHLKPYKCSLCDLSFGMSIALFRHRRKVRYCVYIKKTHLY